MPLEFLLSAHIILGIGKITAYACDPDKGSSLAIEEKKREY